MSVAIEVDCPECENLNRAARRACRFCNHTGKITKYVADNEIVAPETAP
jgi:hypothetical protein